MYVMQTFSEKKLEMVCIWSVFFQKVSIFGLAIIQIDFSVCTLHCVDCIRIRCDDAK